MITQKNINKKRLRQFLFIIHTLVNKYHVVNEYWRHPESAIKPHALAYREFFNMIADKYGKLDAAKHHKYFIGYGEDTRKQVVEELKRVEIKSKISHGQAIKSMPDDDGRTDKFIWEILFLKLLTDYFKQHPDFMDIAAEIFGKRFKIALNASERYINWQIQVFGSVN